MSTARLMPHPAKARLRSLAGCSRVQGAAGAAGRCSPLQTGTSCSLLACRSSRVQDRGRQRRVVAASSRSGSDGGKGSSGEQAGGHRMSLKVQLELLVTLLVRHPGVIGSLAVAGGYVLHLNALPMHWDSHDALLGLQCAIPIVALDSLLMLPDWSPGTATKVIKLKVPKSVAEKLWQREEALRAAKDAAQHQPEGKEQAGEKGKGVVGGAILNIKSITKLFPSTKQTPPRSSSGGGESSSSDSSGGATPAAQPAAADAAVVAVVAAAKESPDEELVDIERTISVRADQHAALAALHRLQTDKASNNVGRLLWFPLELVLLLTWHLAEEMLYRAIILTGAAGWTIDRLYEAGAEERVGLLGLQLATPQAGAVLAAAGCTAASLAVLVQRAFFPLQLISRAEEELDAKEAASRVGPKVQQERARMRKMLDKVRSGMVRQRRWSTAVEGAHDVTEWAAYSTSFLLTGNLLAPYLTAVTSDLLFSGYQRLKARQVDRSTQQAMASIRDLYTTAMAMKDARKAALQPPPVPMSKPEDEQQGGSGSNGSNPGAEAGTPAAAAAEEGSSVIEPEKEAATVGAVKAGQKSK